MLISIAHVCFLCGPNHLFSFLNVFQHGMLMFFYKLLCGTAVYNKHVCSPLIDWDNTLSTGLMNIFLCIL